MTIKEIQTVLETALNNAVALLPEEGRIPVESSVPSVENYQLSHPVGSLLLVYNGASFSGSDLANWIEQERVLEYNVVIVARYSELKAPFEWVDFVLNAVSGLEIDRKLTFVTKDEWLDESGGVWTYVVTVAAPVTYLKG